MKYNIADLFESLADAIGDKVALVSGEHRLTYGQLDERANRLAHYWLAQGLGRGDHIGLHLFNDHRYVEGMLAAFKMRAVPINLNYRYVADELRYLVDNADLVAAVTHRELSPVLAEAAKDASLKSVIVVEDGSGVSVDGLESASYEEALAGSKAERGFEERSGDDIYMVYTGGTTGMPKGVMWRQEDVFFAGLQGGRPGDDPIEKPEELAEYARIRRPGYEHPAGGAVHSRSGPMVVVDQPVYGGHQW